MATIYENLRWKLWELKRNFLFKTNIDKISKYDQELLDKLHNIYYGGLPISVLLLNSRMCLGKCYDKALLLTLGLQDYDYQQVDADVTDLTINPHACNIIRKYKIEHYGNHSFIEATIKDGKKVVYDTTKGLMFDRDLYYELYNPKITKVNTKEEVQKYIEYQEIIEYNKRGIGDDKYFLPLLMELLEENINNGCTLLYEEEIRYYLKKFKEDIGYEVIVKQKQKEKNGFKTNI